MNYCVSDASSIFVHMYVHNRLTESVATTADLMKLLCLMSACRIMVAFFAYILVFAAVLPLSAIV